MIARFAKERSLPVIARFAKEKGLPVIARFPKEMRACSRQQGCGWRRTGIVIGIKIVGVEAHNRPFNIVGRA